MPRVLKSLVAAAMLASSSACLLWFGRQPAIVYVAFAPPTPPVDVMIAAPGPRYAWRPGFFRWDSRTYVWVPGTWIAMAPGVVEWVPGRWDHGPRGWYWIEGYWR